MTARDLRDWLAAATSMGELTDVKGADWNLEIGAISQLNYRNANPSALLFDDIDGYPPGLRVLTASVSNARRMAMTLGLGEDLDNAALVEALRGKPAEWAAHAADFGPNVVSGAPLLENVVDGTDVDLRYFPAPHWNELDGGRFIGTGCIVLTSDPDTGVVNGGAYRLQIQDEGRTCTVNIVPGKHGHHNVHRWIEKEGRAPVVAVVGMDPLLLILAGTEVPTGVSELAYAGAIAGEPLDVVHSDMTGLPIPASSEIVIEGYIDPGRTYSEGPFAEWTGHYSASPRPVFSIDVSRVLHRDDPIILGSPPGRAPHDFSYMRTVFKSAMIHDAIEGAGIPGLKGVWAHEQGGGRMFYAVAIEQRYCGHSRQAGYIAAQAQAAAYMNRFVVVVDDDIDPTSLDDVVWAMCTRCDPGVDIEIMRKTWGGKVDPILADKDVRYNSRALIDACIPFEMMESYHPVVETNTAYSKEVARKWSSALGWD